MPVLVAAEKVRVLFCKVAGASFHGPDAVGPTGMHVQWRFERMRSATQRPPHTPPPLFRWIICGSHICGEAHISVVCGLGSIGALGTQQWRRG